MSYTLVVKTFFLVLHEFLGCSPQSLWVLSPPVSGIFLTCLHWFAENSWVPLLMSKVLCSSVPWRLQLPWPPWTLSSSSSTVNGLGISRVPFLPRPGHSPRAAAGTATGLTSFVSHLSGYTFFVLFCLMSKIFGTIVWSILPSVFVFVFSLGFLLLLFQDGE